MRISTVEMEAAAIIGVRGAPSRRRRRLGHGPCHRIVRYDYDDGIAARVVVVVVVVVVERR